MDDFSIAIGSDDAATDLKNSIMAFLKEQGFHVEDFGDLCLDGTSYPDVAYELATSIRSGIHQRGILFCGTGIGMAITANKVPGIRAAQAHDTYSAQRARKSNNAQILTLGARVIGTELAKEIVKAFLESEFEAGRSGPKVERIQFYENVSNKKD
ncbi:ribose-5-phosphate isomerase B [Vibrio nigripulchritudo ATCC 27043]|uniref:ribose 5-phosphate isomerase B n=1 Tax=Vibrio nigripulchritudo TaxID=28173 RepID=UPI00021C2E39|nr:ribose 5-phosphate isomerase B [Vibrio nigripulchritudo]EGU55208.1 ribose-5-phosphate isomerase B [Vibrio nigripulchritudo ATCC 27043]